MIFEIIKSLRVSLLLLLIFTISATGLKAQTVLTTGDIAFIGYQSGFTATPTPKDRFAFVLLKAVETDTRIIINDNAVLSTNPLTFCKNESQIFWRATSPLPVGTVIMITESDSIATFGKVIGSLSSNQSGDQLMAMQANGSDTTLLAGFSMTTWAIDCATSCGGANNNFTCLPPPLVNGVNAVTLNTTINNGFLNVSQLTGTPAEILAIINDVNNWTTSNTEQPWTAGSWQFSVTTATSKKLESHTSFSIAPNPSQGILSISSNRDWSRGTISNALGTKVFDFKYQSSKNLDMSELAVGMYFIQLFNSENKPLGTHRWIKK